MHMKWENHGIKTPLARAKGLGAARSAVDGWINLRVAAIAIALLSVWLVCFINQSIGLTHAEFSALLAKPVNAVPMILLIAAVFYHAILGTREIVEDYIHGEFTKITTLVVLYLFFVAAAVAGVFSVLKVAFAAGV